MHVVWPAFQRARCQDVGWENWMGFSYGESRQRGAPLKSTLDEVFSLVTTPGFPRSRFGCSALIFF
jgi:hypothetical protein